MSHRLLAAGNYITATFCIDPYCTLPYAPPIAPFPIVDLPPRILVHFASLHAPCSRSCPMPTIIDRYMLRQFVQVLVICLMSLIGLYIVIDAFGHLDHFVDYAGKHGNLLGIMVSYYAYRAIAFFDRTSGVLTLIAVMFTVTWIQRHHEMTALLAAGISRLRVLRPVLMAAIGVSLLAAANREFVMPNIREHLAIDSKNLGGEQASIMQSRFDSQTDILLGGEKIVPADAKDHQRRTSSCRGNSTRYGKQLTAKEAVYLPANDDLPSGYLLSGVTAPKALLKSPSLLLDDKPVVITPVGNDWLQHDQVFVVSGVSFEFLAAGATWRDFASTPRNDPAASQPQHRSGRRCPRRHPQPLHAAVSRYDAALPRPAVRRHAHQPQPVHFDRPVPGRRDDLHDRRAGLPIARLRRLAAPPLAAWLPLMIFAPIAAAMSDTLRQ